MFKKNVLPYQESNLSTPGNAKGPYWIIGPVVMNYTSEKFTNQRCKLLSEITNFFSRCKTNIYKKKSTATGG